MPARCRRSKSRTRTASILLAWRRSRPAHQPSHQNTVMLRAGRQPGVAASIHRAAACRQDAGAPRTAPGPRASCSHGGAAARPTSQATQAADAAMPARCRRSKDRTRTASILLAWRRSRLAHQPIHPGRCRGHAGKMPALQCQRSRDRELPARCAKTRDYLRSSSMDRTAASSGRNSCSTTRITVSTSMSPR